MTATATVKDQELMPFGLVESESENFFAEFASSNLNEMESNDFINIFICHLIFYSFFCIALVYHIVVDLGLGSFVKNKFIQLIEIAKNTLAEETPAFA